MPDYNFYPEMGIQSPDLLGNYLRGLAAPSQIQETQARAQLMQGEAAQQPLKLQQLQMALRAQQAYSDMGQRMLTGQGGPADQGQGAPSVGRTGGIQNGPQDAVAGTAAAAGPAAPFAGSGYQISPQTAMGLEFLKMGAGGQGDPLGAMEKAQQFSRQQQQIGWANDSSFQGEAFMRQMATSPDAPSILKTNIQQLGGVWAQAALKAGVDARNMDDVHSVNKVAAMVYNQRALQMGLPPIQAPAKYNTIYGANGQMLQQNADTGEEKEVVGQKLPTYSLEKTGYNPATGKETGQMVQTSPGGSPVPGAPGAGRGATGGVGAQIGPSIDLGYKEPTPENIKQAVFASTLHSGLQTVRSLENQGFALNQAQRALLIQVATKEDVSDIHQLAYQIGLKKMGPQAQAYLAGMMPVIQAVSHDQSGARLNGTQVRTNLESVLPVDITNKAAMAQVNSMRDDFQNATNVGAGSVGQTPEFKNTIGAMRQQTAANANLPTFTPEQARSAPSGTRFRSTDGRILVTH